jgi:hypothetical protein
MTHPAKHAFHSTGQFRNVVRNVQQSVKFKGFNEAGVPILDELAIAPTLEYIGTVKLHGTNASIVLDEDGTISFHSKNNLLGYIKNGEFTLLSDNAEFAQTMVRRLDSLYILVERAKTLAKAYNGVELYPLKISGEWCGSGIQSSVGISFLPKKSLFIFGIKAGDTEQALKQGWLPVELTYGLSTNDTILDGFYAITDFPTKKVTIDFQNPMFSQNTLVEYTEACEAECPVSKQLNLMSAAGEPQLLGEGLVWTPVSDDYNWDSGFWFKTKGEKHSVSKTKSVAAVDTEKLSSIQAFVDYAVTEVRLQQGLGEVGLSQKSIGTFIGWVAKDINKEESDTLENNNITMKDVGSVMSNKSRTWYIEQLNKLGE